MTAASAVAAGSSTRKRSRERKRRTDAPSVNASICMRSESGARTSTAWSVANALLFGERGSQLGRGVVRGL